MAADWVIVSNWWGKSQFVVGDNKQISEGTERGPRQHASLWLQLTWRPVVPLPFPQLYKQYPDDPSIDVTSHLSTSSHHVPTGYNSFKEQTGTKKRSFSTKWHFLGRFQFSQRWFCWRYLLRKLIQVGSLSLRPKIFYYDDLSNAFLRTNLYKNSREFQQSKI